MIRGEGSSSPCARLIIVRPRRQSQHEACRDTDGQQQREAKHHLEHEFPNLKTSHPDVQTEEVPPRGVCWQQPLYVSRAFRGPCPEGGCFA